MDVQDPAVRDGIISQYMPKQFSRTAFYSGLVKSLKKLFSVIPAQAGIQSF
jgi:hypothetical protein